MMVDRRTADAAEIADGDRGIVRIALCQETEIPAVIIEAADNADAQALAAARKALEDRVLQEAKTITKYIHVPDTTPFAILYLATEGLYAEITSSNSGIIDRIQRENIMVAGPTTIIALLNSLSMGFKAVAIN